MPVETITITPKAQTVTFLSGQQVTIEKKDVQVVVRGIKGASGPQGIQGVKGDPGEGGVGGTINLTAASILSGHRVITTDAHGDAIYADKDTLAHVGKVLGISMNAAMAGALVAVKTFGEFSEPTWNWNAGEPLYLGANGVLTQTPPVTGFLLEVAFALTSTLIFISLKQPFVRS